MEVARINTFKNAILWTIKAAEVYDQSYKRKFVIPRCIGVSRVIPVPKPEPAIPVLAVPDPAIPVSLGVPPAIPVTENCRMKFVGVLHKFN